MNRCMQVFAGCAAVGALLAVDTIPVRAQAIEEILVAARKRTESAQDVPVVIQAFDQAMIDRYAASNLEEIAECAARSNSGREDAGRPPDSPLGGLFE